MAQSPDGLQPIIKRSLSPHTSVANAAARSPSFISSPPPTSNSPNLHSPNSSTANLNTASSNNSNTPPSYFSQQHAGSTPMSAGGATGHQSPNHPPPTPGILLNKHDNNSTTTLKDPHRTQSPPPVDNLLRVSSPTSASDSGFSSTSQDGANSPPPALGSPVNTSYSPTSTMPNHHFKPALEAVLTSDLKRSTPSPPSPHCHFAPLPKPEERPQSRRSSIVSGRVKPFIPRPPERSESMSTAGGGDNNNDEALASGEYTPSNLSPTVPGSFFPSSTSEHFSALSQRLSSSLTFAAPTARHPSSPSRPTSRRSSSSRRSRSPSPPNLFRGGERDRTNSSTSRTHSPNLSRRPSTDALSLHYIEAGAEGGGRGVNLSRQNSRAGSERGPPEDALTMSSPPLSGSGSGIRRPGSTERRSTFDMTKTASSSSTGAGAGAGGMVDKDKEADLHRLMEKAQHGNVDAERAVSPALHAKEKREREREASVGRGRSERETKGPETEVVEVPRGGEGETEELEEVTEEEEETFEEEEENEDEEEDNEEENDSQEDEEEEEPDRSRDEDDDDDDEDEEEPAEERKTSKGAAVEVVRWHRDDPQPASSTNETIPEDSLAEQEAEEETILQSQNNSRRPSAIGTPISTD